MTTTQRRCRWCPACRCPDGVAHAIAANGPRRNLANRSRPDERAPPASLMCAQVVRESFRENLVLGWTRKVVATREIRAPVGHHVFDAGAVLGGVQGSPLRFDRARARPSGLDAASAQLPIGNYAMAAVVAFWREQLRLLMSSALRPGARRPTRKAEALGVFDGSCF